MPAKLHVITDTVTEIPFQDASMDIWDTKYRLKTKDGVAIDENIDETYQRVARALAQVEKATTNKTNITKNFFGLCVKALFQRAELSQMPVL